MDRQDFGGMLRRVLPPVAGPVVAVLAPEVELRSLTLAAREAVFEIDERTLPTSGRDALRELDRASEPFTDMLDDKLLAEDEERRREKRAAVDRVRAWVDAGCITLPPVRHLRTLLG